MTCPDSAVRCEILHMERRILRRVMLEHNLAVRTYRNAFDLGSMSSRISSELEVVQCSLIGRRCRIRVVWKVPVDQPSDGKQFCNIGNPGQPILPCARGRGGK